MNTVHLKIIATCFPNFSLFRKCMVPRPCEAPRLLANNLLYIHGFTIQGGGSDLQDNESLAPLEKGPSVMEHKGGGWGQIFKCQVLPNPCDDLPETWCVGSGIELSPRDWPAPNKHLSVSRGSLSWS